MEPSATAGSAVSTAATAAVKSTTPASVRSTAPAMATTALGEARCCSHQQTRKENHHFSHSTTCL